MFHKKADFKEEHESVAGWPQKGGDPTQSTGHEGALHRRKRVFVE